MAEAEPGARAAARSAEQVLAEQLETQREIARLSSLFLSLEAREIGDAVERELAAMGALARCERITLLGVDEDGELARWDWCAAGHDADHIVPDAQTFRWSSERAIAGEVIQLGVGLARPDGSDLEWNAMVARGVLACVCVPIHFGDRITAFFVFERLTREEAWSDDEIVSLQLVGEIFASALRRRAVEGALRSSEERFRTITEQATELVAEFDPKGHYCYASPSYETLLGVKPDELIGQNGNLLVHPDDVGGSRETFVAAFQSDVESHSIHRLRRADGEWRWYENSGRAYRAADGSRRFVSIGHDITERVEAQIALEAQIERERTVAEMSRRLMDLRGDAITPEVQRSLEQTATLAGADRAFLVSMPDGRHRGSHSEWSKPGIAKFRLARRPWAEAKLRAGEILHFPRVGEMPEEASAERESIESRGMRSMLSVPVKISGETVGVLGVESVNEREWSEHEIAVLRLVGEILTAALRRQGAEVALRESQQQLAQAQKLEAVGRLAGGIAHDFNNLLTVILGLSRPILSDFDGDDETRADLREIHDAAERAAGLTRQLLTFSRRHPLEEQLFDLDETIRSLRPLLARLLGEDIDLLVDADGETGLVQGDTHQFEQVIVNLAANARDAMPSGGTLRVATNLQTPDRATASRLGLGSTDPHLVVSVSDTGDGMDPETVAHIFDPFFTTKEPGKGTGLGLSIVYSVVDQAGGQIDVESAPGKGSTFHLWLPITHGLRTGPGVSPETAHAVASGRVLLVEDEPSVRRLVRRILERAGWEVVEANNGRSAIEIAEREGDSLSAVVTDVVMPAMSGGELARRLREALPAMPILFVSGHPEERGGPLDIERADVLRKPFTAEALTERLAALIDD